MAVFKFMTKVLEDNLQLYGLKSMMAIRMYAETQAKALESDMKKNAVWTNRTGDARKRLSGSVSSMPHGFRITLAHGVDYGIWLELAHEEKFAIINPTITLKSNDVMKGFNHLLDRLDKF